MPGHGRVAMKGLPRPALVGLVLAAAAAAMFFTPPPAGVAVNVMHTAGLLVLVACSVYLPLFFFNVVWFVPLALLPRGVLAEVLVRLVNGRPKLTA